ncbi:MAG TPA: PHP domain-containing protein [Bacillota bacterium]
MLNKYQIYFTGLNHPEPSERLENLRRLAEMVAAGEIGQPQRGVDVNNHIHTIYSFSPYSPAKAIWMAYQSGLTTAGIMDHDSISGALEFVEAGRIVGMATTIGVECRSDFSGTHLKGRRINNPDQPSVAYVALHGIPHTKIDEVKRFFAPYLEERNIRNRQMVERINDILKSSGVKLDFTNDVLAISSFAEGGSVTERHILYALAGKFIERYGKGESLVGFLKNQLGLNLSPKLENFLGETANEFYQYDLLSGLKSDLVSAFYIDATRECPDIKRLIEFAGEIGAIPAYAYLGDVEASVTGDKKNQKFEDDYLDFLFEVLGELGFKAVTYMPTRNSASQLERVRNLCRRYGFFQISGEDINSPRQSFICNALRDEKYQNLVASAWALIGHELSATEDVGRGLFTPDTTRRYPDLNDRIKAYEAIGKQKVKIFIRPRAVNREMDRDVCN